MVNCVASRMPETTFDAPSLLKSSVDSISVEGHKQQDGNEINNESERRHHSKDTRSSKNTKLFLSRRYAENSIESSKSSSRTTSSVVAERSVFRSNRAIFRSRTLLGSHFQMMAPKRTIFYYRCSSCNFIAQSSNTVQNHIRQVSKTSLFHKKSASCDILVKLPNDGHFKLTKTLGKSKYEQLSSKKTLKTNPLMTEPVEPLAKSANLSEDSLSPCTNIVMTEIPANFTDVPAIKQSTAVSFSVMDSSTMMADNGLDCVSSAEDVNNSIENSDDLLFFKFQWSNIKDTNVDNLVKESDQYLKEKEMLNLKLEVGYRNLETTETQVKDTQQAILEQQKKIDDFKDKFAKQHNLLETSNNPILLVLDSLTKEKTAKLEKQCYSLKKDLSGFKEEVQALGCQIDKVADIKVEMEIMEAIVISLQDHLLILRSKMKDHITDQIKLLEEQVILAVKIVYLNCLGKLKAIDKSLLESYKKFSQFSKT